MAIKVPEQLGIDVALVEMVVPNDLRSAKEPEDRIMGELARCGYDPDTTFGIKLALEEAMTNAVKHGNKNDACKHITVGYHIGPEQAVIMIRDEGPGFRPERVPDPTADENLERPSGRGIMLMNCYMTRIWYNDQGNEVWMIKRRA